MNTREAELALDAIIRELNGMRFDEHEGVTIVWDRRSRTWAVHIKGQPSWVEGKPGESCGAVCIEAKREAREPQVAVLVVTEERVEPMAVAS